MSDAKSLLLISAEIFALYSQAFGSESPLMPQTGKSSSSPAKGVKGKNAATDQSRGASELAGLQDLSKDELIRLLIEEREKREQSEVALKMPAMSEVQGDLGENSKLDQTVFALKKSQAQLQLAVDSAQLGICEWDLETNQLTWSRGHFTLFGYEPFSFKPYYQHWRDRIHPEDILRVEHDIEQSRSTGAPLRTEFRVVLPQGQTRWLHARGAFSYNMSGEPVSLNGVILDVTARRQWEYALERLAGIGSFTGPAFFAELVKALSETLGVSYGFAGELAPEKGDMVQPLGYWAHGDLAPSPDYHLCGTPCETVIQSKGTRFYRSGVAAQFPEDHYLEALKLEAYLGTPLRSCNGTVIGILSVQHEGPINEDLQPTAIIELFAGRAAAELERKRAEQSLEFTQFAIDCSSDAVFWVDSNFRFFYANEAAARLTGYRREELVRLSIFDIDPAFTLEKCKEAWNELKNRHYSLFQSNVRRRDGKTVPVEIVANHLLHQGKEYNCTFVRDISERKQWEEDREKFYAFAENSVDFIGMATLEGQAVYVNPAGRQLVGVGNLEEVSKTRVSDYCSANSVQRLLNEIIPKVLQGESWEGHLQFKHFKTGELIDVSERVFLVRLYEKIPAYIATIARDITKQRKSEEALRQKEERLRIALDAGKLGIWEWDIASNRVIWSDRLYEFHGLKPGEFQGTVEAFASLVHPDDLSMVQSAIQRALTDRLPYELEFRAVWSNGEVRWLSTRARVLFDELGQPARMVGVTSDQTNQKNIELALQNAHELLAQEAKHLEKLVRDRTHELREMVAELEGFSYSITHDMRAPLRAMQGFARALVDEYSDRLDKDGRLYLERIMAASVRQDRLIQDVLSYSQIVRQQVVLEPVDLDALIDEIVTQYPNLQAPGVQIEVVSPLGMVMGNQAFLTQCMSNLLGNAVKFVAKGTSPKLKIWTEPQDAVMRIWLKDNGIGISAENQKRIFAMFERVHSQKEFEGTGIGLAIVRKAVQRMNGKLGVESELGAGSRFWIELPKAS